MLTNKQKTCEFCGRQDLYWMKISTKRRINKDSEGKPIYKWTTYWRLADQDGTQHSCDQYRPKTNKENKPKLKPGQRNVQKHF
jgi:hypothetical protein